MGDEQRLPYDELLRRSREDFDAGTDFTVAVEEEFQLLDPESLDLVNRFEELQASAQGTPLEPYLAGELIASEAEIKTGRCEDFREAAARLGERRAQLSELAAELGLVLGASGTHPWASWKDQRIIDTPHYRRNDELLRYVVWRNNSFGAHVHVGIRGADRAIRVGDGLRAFLPDLLALSASSPFVEDVDTGLHSARTEIFTRLFPRCGIPDVYGGWDEWERYVRLLYETGSVTEHTQLWWSVRAHLAFPTVEIRICDGQPDLGESRSLAALAYALTCRIARALDEGEEVPLPANRLVEENLWRATRWGLSGELLDLRRPGRVRPARAAIEELVEWVLPVAEELGAASWLAVPDANSAERQLARRAQGASRREVFEEQALAVEAVR
jgi:carboxylate-amine ligase